MSKNYFSITCAVILLLVANNTFSQEDSALSTRPEQLERESNHAMHVAQMGKEHKCCGMTLEMYYSYGDIRGFMQTPAGGQSSSSSVKRPTFRELGMDSVEIAKGRMSFVRPDYTVYVAINYISLSESASLSQDLITRNELFDAGSQVRSDVKLNYYTLGCQLHNFLSLQFDSITINPLIEAVAFDFDYRLSETGGPLVLRSYSRVGGRLGLKLDWDISDNFSLSAQALAPVPISNTPYIWNASLMGKYLLYNKDDLSLFLNAGISYEIIDYEDNQPFPNHVRAEMGPMVNVGLAVHF